MEYASGQVLAVRSHLGDKIKAKHLISEKVTLQFRRMAYDRMGLHSMADRLVTRIDAIAKQISQLRVR